MNTFIACLFGLFLFYTSVILPWLNFSRIKELREELEALKHPQKKEARHPERAHFAVTPDKPVIGKAEEDGLNTDINWRPKMPEPQKPEETYGLSDGEPLPARKTASRHAPQNYEQQLGGRAFVWIGGIALALAGFYLVKYSIESGLMSPAVRVVLGTLFGFAMLGAGHIVRSHAGIANGQRISQALTGAAVADLYGCLFAATTLYHFLPSWLGFAGMAAVTALALALSLRHGMPIALLGLAGGYATPLMIHGEPHAPLLFGYLYLLFIGFVVLVRHRNWWWLSLPATLVGFLWVGIWLWEGLAPVDGAWLSLFLIGIAASVLMVPMEAAAGGDARSLTLFRAVSFGGAVLLLAMVVNAAHFGTFEWLSLGVMSAGALALAIRQERTYVYAPWLALTADSALLLIWKAPDVAAFGAVLAWFGTLFVGAGFSFVYTARNRLQWAGIGMASLLGYYLIAYDKLAGVTVLQDVPAGLSSDGFGAAGAALGMAVLAAMACQPFVLRQERHQRQRLQAIYSSGATAFLSIGFAVILHQEFLSFAVAGQIVLLSWLYSRRDIPALRQIVMAVIGLFGLLLVQQCFGLMLMPFDSFAGPFSDSFDRFRSVSELIFRLGLPSVLLAVASWVLREKEDGRLRSLLEGIAVALFTLMSFTIIGRIFMDRDMAFIARGVFNDLLLGMGIALLEVARWQKRPSLGGCGVALASVAALRLLGFDLLVDNPLWTHQYVGALPLINALVLAYGLPAGLLAVLGRTMGDDKRRVALAAAYALGFVFVSMVVRQISHGAYLDSGATSSAEVYGYSAAWLAYGVALLFGGVVRRDSVMRSASLAVMVVTVGKVFLYDASALTGLWRVVSLAGLGMSLLGLSWFYSRFVFSGKGERG